MNARKIRRQVQRSVCVTRETTCAQTESAPLTHCGAEANNTAIAGGGGGGPSTRLTPAANSSEGEVDEDVEASGEMPSCGDNGPGTCPCGPWSTG